MTSEDAKKIVASLQGFRDRLNITMSDLNGALDDFIDSIMVAVGDMDKAFPGERGTGKELFEKPEKEVSDKEVSDVFDGKSEEEWDF